MALEPYDGPVFNNALGSDQDSGIDPKRLEPYTGRVYDQPPGFTNGVTEALSRGWHEALGVAKTIPGSWFDKAADVAEDQGSSMAGPLRKASDYLYQQATSSFDEADKHNPRPDESGWQAAGTTLGNIVGGLNPVDMVMSPGATVKHLMESGVDANTARTIGIMHAGVNAAYLKMPTAMPGTLGQRIALGAGANVGADIAQRAVENKILEDYPNAQSPLVDASSAVPAIFGGALGGFHERVPSFKTIEEAQAAAQRLEAAGTPHTIIEHPHYKDRFALEPTLPAPPPPPAPPQEVGPPQFSLLDQMRLQTPAAQPQANVSPLPPGYFEAGRINPDVLQPPTLPPPPASNVIPETELHGAGIDTSQLGAVQPPPEEPASTEGLEVGEEFRLGEKKIPNLEMSKPQWAATITGNEEAELAKRTGTDVGEIPPHLVAPVQFLFEKDPQALARIHKQVGEDHNALVAKVMEHIDENYPDLFKANPRGESVDANPSGTESPSAGPAAGPSAEAQPVPTVPEKVRPTPPARTIGYPTEKAAQKIADTLTQRGQPHSVAPLPNGTFTVIPGLPKEVMPPKMQAVKPDAEVTPEHLAAANAAYDKALADGSLKFDDQHDIPYLGSSNISGQTIYHDRDLPQTLVTKDGIHFQPRKYTGRHEFVEKFLENLGYDYSRAHAGATAAEHEAVKADKLTVADYEDTLKPHIEHAAAKKNPQVPHDLEMKPEEHPHTKRQKEIFDRVNAQQDRPITPAGNPIEERAAALKEAGAHPEHIAKAVEEAKAGDETLVNDLEKINPPKEEAAHIEEGESEPVTPKEVEKVARTVEGAGKDPEAMRAGLIKQIHAAIADAPTAEEERAAEKNKKHPVNKLPDHVHFDVPGDGRFKVRNNKERLTWFAEQVGKSRAFSKAGMPQTRVPVPPIPGYKPVAPDFEAEGSLRDTKEYKDLIKKKPSASKMQKWFGVRYKGKQVWSTGHILDLSGEPHTAKWKENIDHIRNREKLEDQIDGELITNKLGKPTETLEPVHLDELDDKYPGVLFDGPGGLHKISLPYVQYFKSKFPNAEFMVDKDWNGETPVAVKDGNKLVGVVAPMSRKDIPLTREALAERENAKNAEKPEASPDEVLETRSFDDISSLPSAQIKRLRDGFYDTHFGKMPMDEFHDKVKPFTEALVKAEERERTVANAGKVNEVFPGFRRIPDGTKIRADWGTRIRDQEGTVVGARQVKTSYGTEMLPVVDFGDGRQVTVLSQDIKEVFAPRAVKDGGVAETQMEEQVPEGKYHELGYGPANMNQAIDDARNITGLGVGVKSVPVKGMPMRVPMRYNLANKTMEWNSDYPPISRAHAALAAAEELWHATDNPGGSRTISSTSPRFDLRTGDIAREVIDHIQNGGEFEKFWRYPFDYSHKFTEDRIKAELYARLGALLASDPVKFKRTFPVAYDAYNRALRLVDESPLPGAGLRRQVWSVAGRDAEALHPDRNVGPALPGFGSSGGEWQSDPRLGRFRRQIAAALGADPLGKHANLGGTPAEANYLNTTAPGLFEKFKGLATMRSSTPEIAAALDKQKLTQAIGRGSIKHAFAVLDRISRQAERSLSNVRTVFDKMLSTEEGARTIRDGTHQFETLQPVTNPVMHAFFDKMKTAFDQRVNDVLKTGREMGYLNGYFPHLYKDPAKVNEWMHGYLARNPLEGSKGWTKQRFYETLQAARDAGLEPLSENPADMMQAHLAQLDKYLAMHQIRTDLESRNLVMKDNPDAFRKPTGWAVVNDPAFHGQLIPEVIAKDLNTILGPTLNDSAAWRTFRKVENGLISAALGFSGYHATLTTFDMVSANVGDAIQRAAIGDISGATKSLGNALASPVMSPIMGKRLIAQSLGERPADVQTEALLRMLEQGGHRTHMSPTELNDSAVKLKRLIDQGEWRKGLKGAGATAWEAAHALLENITPLIHKHLVPAQKMTAKVLSLKLELDSLADRLGEKKGDYAAIEKALNPDALRQIAGRVVQQVDDRLGQMNYNNLFMNRMSRDIMQGAVMSPGWQIGTVRTIGGGVADVRHLVQGGPKIYGALDKAGTITDAELNRLTGRTAYLAGMHATIIGLAVGTSYALTGQGPSDTRDYFTIRTGRKNPDGTDERLSIPSYLRDESELMAGGHVVKNVLTMAKNKMNPIFRVMGDLATNKDYAGNHVYNADADSSVQAKQIGEYLAKAAVPFSVTGAERSANAGAGNTELAANVMGFNPAPGYMTRTPFFDYLYEHRDDHGRASLSPEQAAAKSKFFSALNQIRTGQKADLSGFTPLERKKLILYSRSTPQEADFKRLPLQQKLNAWDKASALERKQYHLRQYLFTGNVGGQLMSMPQDERAETLARLKEIRDAR
jgi:hypothetical protein